MKKLLLGLILGIVFGISLSIFAWVNPSGNPPTGGGVLQTQNTGLFINTSTYFTSGNVGIGTTNPGQKLEVAGNASIGYISGTEGGVFITKTSQYGAPAIQGVTNTFAPGTLSINPVGGNVGIGTTAPAQKLHVAGGAVFGTTYGTAGDIFQIEVPGSTLTTLRFDADALRFWSPVGQEILRITESGNVGIGTTAPGAKLELANIGSQPVIKWTASGGRTYGIEPYDNRLILADLGVRRILEADPAGWITLWGNVGIGTTNPIAPLDIKGLLNFNPFIGGGGETRADVNILTQDNTKAALFTLFRGTNTNGEKALIMFRGDNTATVINKFSVNGDSYITGGNVGIGTTAPGARLDVNGPAIFRSNVSIGFSNVRTDFTLAVNGSILAETGIALNLASPVGNTIPVCRNQYNILSTCPSSIRYKKNISDLVIEKDKLFQLVPRKFQWKSSEDWDFGLIAEEVFKIFPELVTYNDKKEIEGVKYEKVGVLLIPVVKEHEEKIMALEKIIKEQQEEIEELKRLIK